MTSGMGFIKHRCIPVPLLHSTAFLMFAIRRASLRQMMEKASKRLHIASSQMRHLRDICTQFLYLYLPHFDLRSSDFSFDLFYLLGKKFL